MSLSETEMVKTINATQNALRGQIRNVIMEYETRCDHIIQKLNSKFLEGHINKKAHFPIQILNAKISVFNQGVGSCGTLLIETEDGFSIIRQWVHWEEASFLEIYKCRGIDKMPFYIRIEVENVPIEDFISHLSFFPKSVITHLKELRQKLDDLTKKYENLDQLGQSIGCMKQLSLL